MSPEDQAKTAAETGLPHDDRRGYDSRIDTAVRIAASALAVAILSFIVVLVVSGTTLRNREDLIDTKEQTAAINEERARNVRENCIKQNRENTQTKEELTRLVFPEPPLTEREAEEGERRIVATTRLIDALAPYQDCNKLVERQVTPTEEP